MTTKTNAPNNKPFAEVIESSLHSFVAQSWQWDTIPSFGSLVIVESAGHTLFGIVNHIKTGSMDPTRYPFAYQKTEEELKAEQPQIFEFLTTHFTCLTVGYKNFSARPEPVEGFEPIRYQLAPTPPKIHAFVRLATPDEYQHFFADNQYLHILFSLGDQITHQEELLLALLTQLQDRNLLAPDQLFQFVESYSLLTGNDYRRLKLFLQRIEYATLNRNNIP